jgi:NADPH-dependent 2,4-dienoyl-CoA reductase/sulfur reductase-like enzyme
MTVRIAIVGGSDAGIEAARRCLELDPHADVSLLVADAFPNWSICGIPYYLSGEVRDWRDLAHRTTKELEGIGLRLFLEHRVTALDLDAQSLSFTAPAMPSGVLKFDRLILGTGARPSHHARRIRRE